MVSWDAGFQFCPFQLFSSLSLLSSVCWQQPCSPPQDSLWYPLLWGQGVFLTPCPGSV